MVFYVKIYGFVFLWVKSSVFDKAHLPIDSFMEFLPWCNVAIYGFVCQ